MKSFEIKKKFSSGITFRRGKFLVGENFRHLRKNSSFFPDEIFPDKVPKMLNSIFQVLLQNANLKINFLWKQQVNDPKGGGILTLFCCHPRYIFRRLILAATQTTSTDFRERWAGLPCWQSRKQGASLSTRQVYTNT